MIDLIFLVLFLLMCFWGARKGILGALMGLVGSLLSYVGARMLVPVLTSPIAQLLQPLVGKILEKAAEGQLEAAGTTVEESIRNLLSAVHAPESLMEAVHSQVENGGGEVLEAAIQTVSQSLAPVIAFLVGFALCKLVLWLLVRVVGGTLPLFRTVNHGAGLCLGALGGAVMIALLCLGLRSFAPEGVGGFFAQEALAESRVASFVYQIFPQG